MGRGGFEGAEIRDRQKLKRIRFIIWSYKRQCQFDPLPFLQPPVYMTLRWSDEFCRGDRKMVFKTMTQKCACVFFSECVCMSNRLMTKTAKIELLTADSSSGGQRWMLYWCCTSVNQKSFIFRGDLLSFIYKIYHIEFGLLYHLTSYKIWLFFGVFFGSIKIQTEKSQESLKGVQLPYWNVCIVIYDYTFVWCILPGLSIAEFRL